jgi:hypothetical protein
MVAESTYDCLTPGRFRTRLLDAVKVKGREHAKAVKVFEVYGETSEPCEPTRLAYYEAYHAGAVAYFHGDFRQAQECFVHALQLRPEDTATQNMLSRIQAWPTGELPADWDGSNVLELK